MSTNTQNAPSRGPGGRPSGVMDDRDRELLLPPEAQRGAVIAGLEASFPLPADAAAALAAVDTIKERLAEIEADVLRATDWNGDGVPDPVDEVAARVAALNDEKTVLALRIGQAQDAALRAFYKALVDEEAAHRAAAREAHRNEEATWDRLAAALDSPDLYAHGTKWARLAIDHGANSPKSLPSGVASARAAERAARSRATHLQLVINSLGRGDFTAIAR